MQNSIQSRGIRSLGLIVVGALMLAVVTGMALTHATVPDAMMWEWHYGMWDDVGLFDRGWTDTGAGSDELAGCVAYALVDDSEAVVIGDVACVFEPIDGLSHRLIRCVEVLGNTTDGVAALGGEDDLRRRVVENLVHLTVTNNPVTVKSLTGLPVRVIPTELDHSGFS